MIMLSGPSELLKMIVGLTKIISFALHYSLTTTEADRTVHIPVPTIVHLLVHTLQNHFVKTSKLGAAVPAEDPLSTYRYRQKT
jgi:hypothetical protein